MSTNRLKTLDLDKVRAASTTALKQFVGKETYGEIRNRAREDFLYFLKLVMPEFKQGDIHAYIAHLLMSDEKRAVINTPPQIGKSTLVAQYFVAWSLGRDPTLRFVCAAYSIDVAKKNSKATLGIVKSDTFRWIFPEFELETDNVEYWQTSRGGYYKAVGRGGALTGFPADVIIVDDPIKDSEEASSDVIREKCWDWYETVVKSRLSERSRLILIMTRWHADDLAGRLLDPAYQAGMSAAGIANNIYTPYVFPAECEDPEHDLLKRKQGEFLWPEGKSEATWKSSKYTVGADGTLAINPVWESLYQQRPVGIGGNMCDRGNFLICSESNLPSNLQWIRYWDLAATGKTRSDFTVGVQLAYDKTNDVLYIRNLIKRRMDWVQVKPQIIEIAKRERVTIGVEGNGGFSGLVQELELSLKNIVKVVGVSVDKDKQVRAGPWMALVNVKKVVLVEGSWNADFINEAANFPNGKHDDQVDAVSGGYALLRGGLAGGLNKRFLLKMGFK